MRIQGLPLRDAVVLILLVGANMRCGGDPNATCVVGMQIACACPGGGSGVQVCDRQGRYGACACGVPSAGGGAGGTNPAADGGGATGGATGGSGATAGSGADGSSAMADVAGPASDVAASVEVAIAPDAGAMPDATPSPDAARIPDAAPTPDVALPPDAAPMPDAALPPDAAPMPDLAPVGVVDAPPPPDAPVPAPDAPTPDAAVIADAPAVDVAPVDVQEQPPGTTQCTDQQHNDGDNLMDSLDPECTGPYDNDEATFGTGVPGDNLDTCKKDCYFDPTSGNGDDGCDWNLKCDPASPGSGLSRTCPYDPAFLNCATQQSEKCRTTCLPIVPNGCDCFGCCAVTRAGNTFSVALSSTCTYADLADPAKCPRCTIQTSCFNPCDACELCLDRPELPAGCASVSCPASAPPCGADGHTPSACPVGTRCLTGCCVPAH